MTARVEIKVYNCLGVNTIKCCGKNELECLYSANVFLASLISLQLKVEPSKVFRYCIFWSRKH